MTGMFTYMESDRSAKIKVIGVGGAGGNAINNMIASNLQGVRFISANTDAQALDVSQAEMRISVGNEDYRRPGSRRQPPGRAGGGAGECGDDHRRRWPTPTWSLSPRVSAAAPEPALHR